MSPLRSVNLNALADPHTHKSSAKFALNYLAEWANGPLRLQTRVEKGVTVRYLGVRSWSTYFFEKLFATDKQKADARRETMVAIEKHVRPFVNEHNLTNPSQATAEELTEHLYSMVTRQPIKEVKVGTTMPYFQSRQTFTETHGKLFHGITRVPQRINVSVGNPLRIIADVHLVKHAPKKSYLMGSLTNGHVVEQSKFQKIDELADHEFEYKYLSMLNNEKGSIQTTVVLELQVNASGQCSEANLEGAKRAADKFLKSQNRVGKNISIMLIVPSLPSSVGSAGEIAKAVSPDGKQPGRNLNQSIWVSEDLGAENSLEDCSYNA